MKKLLIKLAEIILKWIGARIYEAKEYTDKVETGINFKRLTNKNK